MAFPQAFIDELLMRNPVDEVVGDYVSLERRGGNLFGLCPFHSEKTASFSVQPDKGLYYCFGCHKGGGAVNFIMEIEALDYPDAVRFLAKRVNMEVPEENGGESRYRRQQRLWELCRDAARWFYTQLQEDWGRQAREYAAGRGMSEKIMIRFGLGYAPDEWNALEKAMRGKGYTEQDLLDAGLAVRGKNGNIYDRFRNRLMFPIIDIRGNVIGFGGRVMDDSTPKYLNSPESIIFNKRKNLFALNVAKKSKQERIILTEGYMDAIALYQYGFDCAVASLGTSLTEEHASMLAKYTKQVVLTYDGDEAGQNATKRAIPMLEKAGLQVKVLRMQGAKDPDEFLKKYGAARFSQLLDQSENQADYQLESLRRKYNLTEDEQRIQFLREAAALISSFPNAVQREIYGARAAEYAAVSPQAVKLEVDKAYRHRVAAARKKQEQENMQPARNMQPRFKGIRYDNIRSAAAEEGLLRMVLKEPELLPELPLDVSKCSVGLFARVLSLLQERSRSGSPVSLPSLEGEVSTDEMAHLTQIVSRDDCTVSEEAVADYIRVIEEEYAKAHCSGAEDLRRLAESKRRN